MEIKIVHELSEETMLFLTKLMQGDLSPVPDAPPAKPAETKKPPATTAKKQPENKTNGKLEYTKEQVREIANGIKDAGFREEIVEILESYGAAKLTELDPAHYPVFIEKIKALVE